MTLPARANPPPGFDTPLWKTPDRTSPASGSRTTPGGKLDRRGEADTHETDGVHHGDLGPPTSADPVHPAPRDHEASVTEAAKRTDVVALSVRVVSDPLTGTPLVPPLPRGTGATASGGGAERSQ